jgi:hypothetical protein
MPEPKIKNARHVSVAADGNIKQSPWLWRVMFARNSIGKKIIFSLVAIGTTPTSWGHYFITIPRKLAWKEASVGFFSSGIGSLYQCVFDWPGCPSTILKRIPIEQDHGHKKRRLVAGGHLVDLTCFNSCSTNVEGISLRLLDLIKHCIKFLSFCLCKEICNDFITASCLETMNSRAGPEFGYCKGSSDDFSLRLVIGNGLGVALFKTETSRWLAWSSRSSVICQFAHCWVLIHCNPMLYTSEHNG